MVLNILLRRPPQLAGPTHLPSPEYPRQVGESEFSINL